MTRVVEEADEEVDVDEVDGEVEADEVVVEDEVEGVVDVMVETGIETRRGLLVCPLPSALHRRVAIGASEWSKGIVC